MFVLIAKTRRKLSTGEACPRLVYGEATSLCYLGLWIWFTFGSDDRVHISESFSDIWSEQNVGKRSKNDRNEAKSLTRWRKAMALVLLQKRLRQVQKICTEGQEIDRKSKNASDLPVSISIVFLYKPRVERIMGSTTKKNFPGIFFFLTFDSQNIRNL